MKGEHNKPLACVRRRRGRRRCRFGVRGLCGRRGLLLRPADADVRGVRVVAARGGDAEERGSYASTDDAADPLGIAAEKEANASRDASPRDDGPDANPNASLPGKAPNRSSNRKKPVRSKVPPPHGDGARGARRRRRLGRRGRRGRLTSWSARPKPPEFYPEPERKTTASATASGAFGGDALSERPVSERPTEGQKPLKMKKRKLGPGGAPALELLSGARASDPNAPASRWARYRMDAARDARRESRTESHSRRFASSRRSSSPFRSGVSSASRVDPAIAKGGDLGVDAAEQPIPASAPRDAPRGARRAPDAGAGRGVRGGGSACARHARRIK